MLPSKLLGILASGRSVVASSPAGSALGQLAEPAGLRVEQRYKQEAVLGDLESQLVELHIRPCKP